MVAASFDNEWLLPVNYSIMVEQKIAKTVKVSPSNILPYVVHQTYCDCQGS